MHEYSASLRVMSDSVRLASLEERLGTPTRGHDIGEMISPRNPESRPRRHSHWSFVPERSRRAPMDELITELLDYVDARADAFHSLRTTCDIDLFCGIFASEAQGGFVLPVELTHRAAHHRLPIGFDIYCAH